MFVFLADFDFRWGSGGRERWFRVRVGGGGAARRVFDGTAVEGCVVRVWGGVREETKVDASEIFYLRVRSRCPIFQR